jgi:hypothetical protein
MRRVLVSVAALAFGFLVTLAAITLNDRIAPPERERLLDLDKNELTRYCQVEHGESFVAFLYGNTTNDWKCRETGDAEAEALDIDLDGACQRLLATTAYAHTDDQDNPFSLGCYAGERP